MFLEAGYRLEGGLDRLLRAAKAKQRRLGPLAILPYRGYGDAVRSRLKGRVIERKGLDKPEPGVGVRDNLVRMWHRFASAEVPGARVRATFGGRHVEAVTDEEGYFEIALDGLDVPDLPLGQRWREVGLELLAPLDPGWTAASTRIVGHVLTPPGSARFGVISDIDDTIIKTGATNILRNLYTTLLVSVESRIPFRGLATFYKALERGTGEVPVNPVFYVSSSPWNLYDLLEHFMELHGIPPGPMFLRDFGLDRTKLVAGSHHEHKLGAIENLFAFYPALRFILIGDSGQHDAAIYAEVVRRHPGRVLAVYIRDVTPGEDVDREAKRLLAEVQQAGARATFCPDLIEAAADAAAQGWIDAAAVDDVRREVAAEAAASTGKV